MRVVSGVLLLVLTFGVYAAKHDYPESYYQWNFCTGDTEHILDNYTRVDCLTESHAIEVDFASKFYEAIGQSLYYASYTGKRAGILLIIERKKDLKYWYRLNSVIQYYGLPIDVWTTGAAVNSLEPRAKPLRKTEEF